MDKERIVAKFGDDYRASDMTYKLGIDARFADHIASRFTGRVVLETCTGGGFTTIALARYARHVFTAEIDATRMDEAKYNIALARVEEKVTFLGCDIFRVHIESLTQRIDSALIDPDWADTGELHQYRFLNSSTRPASDRLLHHMFRSTNDITLVQPPFIQECEFASLPKHETEKLFLDGNHELFCLHFGELAKTIGETEFRI